MTTAVEKNSYVLNWTAYDWLYKNINKSPKKMISGLLKQRFDNPNELFKNDIDLAKACIELTKKNSNEFVKDPLDHKSYEVFINLNPEKSNEVMESFRLLWRGYTDKDIEEEEKRICADKKPLKEFLKETLQRNNIMLKKAIKNRNEFKQRELSKNETKLLQIESNIEEVFKFPKQLAHCKLSYFVHARRHGELYLFFPNDYTHIKHKIDRYNPEDLNFPLRFLSHTIQAKTFFQLRKEWRDSTSRDNLMASLEKDIKKPWFFERLYKLSQTLKEGINIDISIILEELQKTFVSNCFLATSLLAITQTEGILWDFASYLNQKNIRIFKSLGRAKKKVAYEWNFENETYKKLTLHKRPDYSKNIELNSARKLINTTRLGSIVFSDLYTYLIDEFYNDRNRFAHGDTKNRNYKADAIASLLCFWTCMESFCGRVSS